MYKVAMHRDLSDPHAIDRFARLVDDRRLLAQLYLLTVADICTTSPTSMTDWKSHMLEELYLATEAALGGRAHANTEVWTEQGSELAHFTGTMPARYLRSSTPGEAMLHARAALETGADAIHVACLPCRRDAITELCVVTHSDVAGTGLTVVAEDRPGLLALIAAALAANRLEVCAAEIHTRSLQDGAQQGVDLFWVRTPSADPSRLAARIASVEHDLKRLLKGEISARELMQARQPSRWSEHPTPDVPTRVILDHDASAEFTVVEVLTKDQPGLLFTLTDTLRLLGLSIALAKISTEGARATDAFYVTERSGEKLAPGARARLIEEHLLAALAPSAASETYLA